MCVMIPACDIEISLRKLKLSLCKINSPFLGKTTYPFLIFISQNVADAVLKLIIFGVQKE